MKLFDGSSFRAIMKAQLLIRDALEELLSISGLTIEKYEEILKEIEHEHKTDGN